MPFWGGGVALWELSSFHQLPLPGLSNLFTEPASPYTCLSASSADMSDLSQRKCSLRLSWLMWLPSELASGHLPWALSLDSSRALRVLLRHEWDDSFRRGHISSSSQWGKFMATMWFPIPGQHYRYGGGGEHLPQIQDLRASSVLRSPDSSTQVTSLVCSCEANDRWGHYKKKDIFPGKPLN